MSWQENITNLNSLYSNLTQAVKPDSPVVVSDPAAEVAGESRPSSTVTRSRRSLCVMLATSQSAVF